MNAPPGPHTPPPGITGTHTNAETKGRTAKRVVCAMKAAGIEPHGWQVRSLVASLIANHDTPTDTDVVHALMRAPWFPKPVRRHWRIGEGGGWSVRSP